MEAPAPPTIAEEDPNRPRLRRSAAATRSQVQEAEVPKAEAQPAPLPSGTAQPRAAPKELLAAISDAKPDQFRDYNFDWRPEERKRLEEGARELARSELNRYAGARARVLVGPLQEVEVRAFNLDFSNTPYIVLRATATAEERPQPVRPGAAKASPSSAEPAFHFYVTVVAREDLNGEMRLVLISASDSTRLDAFPRLELIDAVDADGDERAELLFREVSDTGYAYKLYRLVGNQARELFTGVSRRD
jgi:hypothetical protein